MERNHLSWQTALLALALLWLGGAAQAQTIYHVNVNTSVLSGQSGNVDLQFNPGGVDALNATVGISNVITNGTLAASAMDTGGAAGLLPSSATINNSLALNELFQGLTFGSSFSFDATFTGSALNPTPPLPLSGSVFAVSLFDSAGITPLLTTDPGGSVLDIALNPDGSMFPTNFPSNANGGPPAATASLSAPVPESSTVVTFGLLLMLGLGGVVVTRHRKTAV